MHRTGRGRGLRLNGGAAPVGGERRIDRLRQAQAGDGQAGLGSDDLNAETVCLATGDIDVAAAQQSLQRGLELQLPGGVAVGGCQRHRHAGAAVGEDVSAFTHPRAVGVDNVEAVAAVALDAALHRLADRAGAAGIGALCFGGRGRRRNGRLADGKLAAERGVTGQTHVNRAGKFHVACTVKARREISRERQAIDAGDRGRAGQAAASLVRAPDVVGAVLAEPEVARTVAQADPRAVGIETNGDAAGHDVPGAAGAVSRLLERDVESAAELGRAELQRTVHIDLEYALSVGQTHRGVRREGDGRAGGIVRAVPVDHRVAATEHQRTADQLAVEVQPRGRDVRQRVTLDSGAAECCLAGEPAPAAADFAVQNDGDVNVGQARAHRAVTQRRADAGATEDELIDRHAGTTGQQHALSRAALDEHVAVDREHACDIGAHDSAQARFVVQQVDDVVARAGGDDHVFDRRAVAVVGDLQMVGAQRDAVDATERYIAFDLHGISAGRAVNLV